MAGPQPTMIDATPLMAAEMKARADQLAAILDIGKDSYEGHEAEAYQIMANLAAMPAIADHDRRWVYGNEILVNAAKVFSPWSPDGSRFHTSVQGLVITMQEFPAFYTILTESDERLVEDYVTITWILDGMKVAGLGGLGGATTKLGGGARSGFYKGLEASGSIASKTAGAAKGAAIGSAAAATKIVTGGLTARASIFLWIMGEAAYVSLADSAAKMSLEITRRFQTGGLSPSLYEKAMGTTASKPTRYVFPIR